MSKVKRLNFTVSQFESVVPYASEHGQYVRYADYAKLEADAQALREEVERDNRITVAMALDISAVGEALGIQARNRKAGPASSSI
ncbi:TPA: hypothetical protein ACID1M_005325 [Pseudomonas aeruginosa]